MISVLLATYNDEKYIKESIDSVLSQTYKNLELLIGFNGTIDSSKEIVSKISDDRIRIFDYGLESGKAKTLNKLMQHANGEWIAIQDGDDVWAPKKLERQSIFFEDFDVIGSQILYINEFGDMIGGPKLETENSLIKEKSLTGDNQIANTSAIFKKNCLFEMGGWNENLDGIEDFDLWLKLMRKGYKFKNLNTHEVLHRIHNKSNFNTKKFDLKKIL